MFRRAEPTQDVPPILRRCVPKSFMPLSRLMADPDRILSSIVLRSSPIDTRISQNFLGFRSTRMLNCWYHVCANQLAPIHISR